MVKFGLISWGKYGELVLSQVRAFRKLLTIKLVNPNLILIKLWTITRYKILFVIRQFNIGCLFPFPIVVDADLECVVGFGTAVEAAFITDDLVFFPE